VGKVDKVKTPNTERQFDPMGSHKPHRSRPFTAERFPFGPDVHARSGTLSDFALSSETQEATSDKPALSLVGLEAR
jgi:hypothetical protein